MTKDEAMKLALEALKPLTFNAEVRGDNFPAGNEIHKMADAGFKAMTALREALAEQPAQQEPVELCQYGQEPASCTSNPMDCQCAIDAALTQPEQEPVAWMSNHDVGFRKSEFGATPTVPLYTSPPAQRTWVGLTDEEVDDIYQGVGKNDLMLVREVEAKLKEKNT